MRDSVTDDAQRNTCAGTVGLDKLPHSDRRRSKLSVRCWDWFHRELVRNASQPCHNQQGQIGGRIAASRVNWLIELQMRSKMTQALV